MKKISALLILFTVLGIGNYRFAEYCPEQDDMKVFIGLFSGLSEDKRLVRNKKEFIEKKIHIKFSSTNPVNTSIYSSVLLKIEKLFPKTKKTDINRSGYFLYYIYLKVSYFFAYGYQYFIAAGILCLFLTWILLKTKIFSISGFLGRVSFFISRFLCFFTGLFMIIAWLLVKKDFWVPLYSFMLTGPAAALILSSITLKLFDPNYPIYNRALKSLLLPLAAMIIMISSSILL